MCTSYEAPGQMEFEAFSLFSKPSFEYRREIYLQYFFHDSLFSDAKQTDGSRRK